MAASSFTLPKFLQWCFKFWNNIPSRRPNPLRHSSMLFLFHILQPNPCKQSHPGAEDVSSAHPEESNTGDDRSMTNRQPPEQTDAAAVILQNLDILEGNGSVDNSRTDNERKNNLVV